MLASRSLGNAFTALLSFGLANGVTILLLFLWAVSPLGGQALQRILFTGTAEIITPTPISSLNLTYQWPSAFGGADAMQDSASQISSVFFTALNSRAELSTDTWANPKIPFLHNNFALNNTRWPWLSAPGSAGFQQETLSYHWGLNFTDFMSTGQMSNTSLDIPEIND